MSSTPFTTLVCDIGGTNTTFAIISGDPGAFRIEMRHREATQELESFEQGLRRAQQAIAAHAPQTSFDAACISAAGPVQGRTVQLVNASWNVDAELVAEYLTVPVSLINDLSAICYAVPLVERSDPAQYQPLHPHDEQEAAPHGSMRSVVAAGTGLGVGFLSGDGVDLRVYASEGGHSLMGDFDAESRSFRDFLCSRFGDMPDAELFVSGQGIANAAEFVAHHGGFSDATVGEEIRAAPRTARPALVSRYASWERGCMRAMQLFVRMYGKFVANMALTFLPYAGMYLAGGIAEKNLDYLLENDAFMNAFRGHDNTAMRKVLSRIPVGVIRNYDISLFGCAHCAYLEQKREEETP